MEQFQFDFPVIRKNVKNENPPKKGEGIRLGMHQLSAWVGDSEAIERNFELFKKSVAIGAKHQVQIMVFPELYFCGYNIQQEDRKEVVVTKDDPRLQRMAEVGKEHNMAIVMSYAEKEVKNGEERYYDSIIMYDQDGSFLANYRKTSLWGDCERANWHFGYADKDEHKDAYPVAPVNGINVGLLNCYEAEFADLYRILALKGAQLIVMPTAADVGVKLPDDSWSMWAYPDATLQVIPANARQNKVFAAYSNRALWEWRTNGDLSGVYMGNSAISDPYGDNLARAENVETLIVVDCVPGDYQYTHPYGQSDYIKDRRPDLYQGLTDMNAKLPNGSTWEYFDQPNDRRPKK